MPRPDVFRALQADGGFRSGFWATVPVGGRQRLGRSSSPSPRGSPAEPSRSRRWAAIEVGRRAAGAAGAAPDGLIAICMATFEPDLDAVPERRSSRCGRRPTSAGCASISDDCFGPGRFDALRG